MPKPRQDTVQSIIHHGDSFTMDVQTAHRWHCGECGQSGPWVTRSTNARLGTATSSRPLKVEMAEQVAAWCRHLEDEHPEVDLSDSDWLGERWWEPKH